MPRTCGLFTNPPQFKDPLPDSLTWYGVTFFATLDVGYAYQTNGRPLGAVVSGLEFIPFTTTRNYTGQRISTIAESGLKQSNIGMKFDIPLGLGWNAVGRARHRFRSADGKTLRRLQFVHPECRRRL